MATEAGETTADLGALSRLSEQVSGKAEAAREKGRQMLEHRAEYARVRDRLEGLSDVMQHRVMVPMTSKVKKIYEGESKEEKAIICLTFENTPHSADEVEATFL